MGRGNQLAYCITSTYAASTNYRKMKLCLMVVAAALIPISKGKPGVFLVETADNDIPFPEFGTDYQDQDRDDIGGAKFFDTETEAPSELYFKTLECVNNVNCCSFCTLSLDEIQECKTFLTTVDYEITGTKPNDRIPGLRDATIKLTGTSDPFGRFKRNPLPRGKGCR